MSYKQTNIVVYMTNRFLGLNIPSLPSEFYHIEALWCLGQGKREEPLSDSCIKICFSFYLSSNGLILVFFKWFEHRHI